MRGYNSSIEIRKKKCKSCGSSDNPLFSRGRCANCARREDFKPIKKISDKRMQKEEEGESWTNLRDELDILVSLYVRLKDANSAGFTSCFVCDKVMHYKEIHNGHCISRSSMGLRFEIANLRTNCPSCNGRHETHPEFFRNKLEAETPGILSYLDSVDREVNKLSVSDLKEMVIEFREKVRIVKIKLLTK